MMTLNRRLLAALGVGVLGVAMAACTASPDGASAQGTDIVALVQGDQVQSYDDALAANGDPAVPDGTLICYVTRTLSNEYWAFVAQGVENRAKELGADVQIFASQR